MRASLRIARTLVATGALMALAPVASRAHGLTTLDVSTIGNAGSYQSRAFMPLPGIGV